MKTHFKTQPGLFAASTDKYPGIPKGVLRVFTASIEVYDLESESDNTDIKFALLPALAEGNTELAKALLTLRDCITQNEKLLRDQIKD